MTARLIGAGFRNRWIDSTNRKKAATRTTAQIANSVQLGFEAGIRNKLNWADLENIGDGQAYNCQDEQQAPRRAAGANRPFDHGRLRAEGALGLATSRFLRGGNPRLGSGRQTQSGTVP
jgi:hypothetical protein